VASKRERQRKLARARAERQLARRAARTRRRRQIQAGVGAALALVLVVLGVTWALGGFDSEEPPVATPPTCDYNRVDGDNRKDVGLPLSGSLPRSGIEPLNITTNRGAITVLVDLSKVPCTATSFDHLGEQHFYTDITCHRLDTEAKILTCGDPAGDGTGGPTYQFADEALPTEPVAAPTPSASPGESPSPEPSPAVTSYYRKGTMIMANTGPNTNGSQFSIVYDDGSNLPPSYSVVGEVTLGLDIIEEVAAAGAVDEEGNAVAIGKPKLDLTIEQLYLGSTPPPSPDAEPTESPESSPSPTAPAS